MTHLKVSAISFAGALSVLFYKPILGFFGSFLAKNQNLSNILFSREKQIENVVNNFQQNPLFGNGFGVPVLPFRSFSFSMEYTVEPGNLILAVLAYSGIIGLFVFCIYILQLFTSNRNNMTKNHFYF